MKIPDLLVVFVATKFCKLEYFFHIYYGVTFDIVVSSDINLHQK